MCNGGKVAPHSAGAALSVLVDYLEAWGEGAGLRSSSSFWLSTVGNLTTLVEKIKSNMHLKLFEISYHLCLITKKHNHDHLQSLSVTIASFLRVLYSQINISRLAVAALMNGAVSTSCTHTFALSLDDHS